MLDLRREWWGPWLVPALTWLLGIGMSMFGGWLVRRGGARQLETLRYKHRRKQSDISSQIEATASTFQRAVVILTTLLTLCCASKLDTPTGALWTAFGVACLVLFSMARRATQARGQRLNESPTMRAFALGLACALAIGVAAQLTLDHFAPRYLRFR